MLQYTRPQVAATFDSTVSVQRTAVENASRNGLPPDFPELWREFKDEYAAAQHGKCGYCEIAVIAGQDGDVEHFAPKSEIAQLGPDEATWGTEAPNSSRVRGRRPLLVGTSGYWWLAYSWNNYVLSCAVCNRKWKRTVYPVREPPARQIPPDESVVERSLLLDPFGRVDPANHLRFPAATPGSVEPWKRSRQGRETIKTVGLNRPSLQKVREPFVSDAYQAVRELADASAAGDATGQERALRNLHRLGSANRQFAGVVRAIVKQELKLTWSKVDQAVATLGPP